MNAMIRDANTDDIALLIDLTDEIQALHSKARPDIFVYPQNRSALGSHFSDVLASENNHVLLLDTDSGIVGHLYAEIKRGKATPFKYAKDLLYVHQIGIQEGSQGSGYGQMLLAAASDLARKHGLDEIQLDYWSFNAQARRFYDRAGFKVLREVVSKTI